MADFDRDAAFREIVGYVRRRVATNLRVEEPSLPPAPLGELVNLLFLMAGNMGSCGHYEVTLAVLCRTFGRDMVWAEPKSEPEKEKQVVVN